MLFLLELPQGAWTPRSASDIPQICDVSPVTHTECLVCNYCTSNSIHGWAKQGWECWAGANPATAVLVSGSKLPNQAQLGRSGAAVSEPEVCQISSELCAEQKPNRLQPTHTLQCTVQLCLSKSSGINLSHENRCEPTANTGTTSALLLSE